MQTWRQKANKLLNSASVPKYSLKLRDIFVLFKGHTTSVCLDEGSWKTETWRQRHNSRKQDNKDRSLRSENLLQQGLQVAAEVKLRVSDMHSEKYEKGNVEFLKKKTKLGK